MLDMEKETEIFGSGEKDNVSLAWLTHLLINYKFGSLKFVLCDTGSWPMHWISKIVLAVH